jgi:hypothetical protein
LGRFAKVRLRRTFNGMDSQIMNSEASAAQEFSFTPELHLVDGRVVRNIEDAILFAREHEVRPGVDRRDEVIHRLERAKTEEEVHAAALNFIGWLEGLAILD